MGTPVTSNENQPAPVISPFVKAFAGSIGGLAEAACLQPIDVIKTRLQLDSVQQYKGVADCGRQIIAQEGVKSLWKGLTPFSINLTAKYALRMGTNAVYQGFLRDESGQLSQGRRLLSGLMAGVTEAMVVVTPMEVIKIRMQAQRGTGAGLKYTSPIQCASLIVKEEGFRALWNGATPTIMRNGTNQMCLFWAKHNLDRLLWKKKDGDGMRLTPGQSMTSGFVAACLGPVATGPFDVAKTRIMAQLKSDGPPRYRGFFHALMTIPREEGLRAMWKGLLPRLMRIPPGQAIVWMVSDQITGYLEKKALDEQGRRVTSTVSPATP